MKTTLYRIENTESGIGFYNHVSYHDIEIINSLRDKHDEDVMVITEVTTDFDNSKHFCGFMSQFSILLYITYTQFKALLKNNFKVYEITATDVLIAFDDIQCAFDKNCIIEKVDITDNIIKLYENI